MDLLLGILLVFCSLIISIWKGFFIAYPLLIALLTFSYISMRRGYSFKSILAMAYSGVKKALIVLKIFLLIGAITSVWMASGTVAGIVYYGIKYMNPNYFILYAFLISSLMSFLLGTAFGTTSTVGVALIIMAKGGGIDLSVAAGAIIGGAYFGDRCSPMSSSANLVANLTDTNLYTNIRSMFKTGTIPYIVSMILYLVLSLRMPLTIVGSSIDNQILNTFNISFIVLLPALAILALSIFKVDVKISMVVSIIIATFISIFIQGYDFLNLIKYMTLGFKLDTSNPLYDILAGGGIIPMYKAQIIVFISCSLGGILSGTNLLSNIDDLLLRAKNSLQLFLYTIVVSIITGALGSNQTISVVLTNELMKKTYNKKGSSNYDLSINLENTAIVLTPLIPWNIAAFVPATTLGVSNIDFIPYAFYLYLIPIFSIIHYTLKEKNHNSIKRAAL
ncbi:Na+/H+ antiporter NhaC family protein [Anaeromicrobium sediminis]|uniref:Sodium:proton antiporter n=1 Tax=Anaeromicrobium sediminis TaxID=1478221 RepID=A0A267MJM5_9FIRM|nr:Na+/H+ antiporter NhaC family protein [Anaeromicrobium sediminis]PAB59118.1 sodium:proton antiporter [Anaeromicrobium sediminis]